jgi:very-short-patch-repair endonuclease
MRVKDSYGRQTSWNLSKYVGKENPNPSFLHLKARKLLKEKFQACQILEEVYLPNESLYLDFFIPSIKLAVEIQGRQHKEFVPYFHGNNKKNFQKSIGRDKRKAEWCLNNSIELIYFESDEDEKQWQTKLDQL